MGVQEILDMMFSNERAGVLSAEDWQVFKTFVRAFEIIRENLPENLSELTEETENIVGEMNRINFEYGVAYGTELASGMWQMLSETDRIFSQHRKDDYVTEEILRKAIKVIHQYKK